MVRELDHGVVIGDFFRELKYDNEGRPAEVIERPGSFNSKEYPIYYNDKGLKNSVTKRKYIYDNQGRLIKEMVYEENGCVSTVNEIEEYTYTENEVINIWTKNNELKTKATKHYKDGLVVSLVIHYFKNDHVKHYGYKYLDFDDHSNWTKRLEISKSDTLYQVRRITYYS